MMCSSLCLVLYCCWLFQSTEGFSSNISEDLTWSKVGVEQCNDIVVKTKTKKTADSWQKELTQTNYELLIIITPIF